MREFVRAWAFLAWLAGLGLGLASASLQSIGEPEMPHVSENNWGQHAPRTGRVELLPPGTLDSPWDSLRPSVPTPFTPEVRAPRVPDSSFVDPRAVLQGDVRLGPYVLVAPFVSVRADEGSPIHIGRDSNLQDGVVIHGLPTRAQGRSIPQSTYEVGGERYSVYVESQVSVEHQAQLHGPVWIERDVWIGMRALVSGSRVGRGAVIEPGAIVLGVRIPEARYVPAGVVVNRQSIADRLPEITAAYPLRHRNRSSLRASRTLVEAYVHASH